MIRNSLIVLVALALAACATSGVDKNYAAALEARNATQQQWAQVEIEKARTEAARYAAMQAIATAGDSTNKTMALFALATAGNSGSMLSQARTEPMPQLPESQSDKAYKWAALFAGPLTNIASGYFGYRLGTVQSNNQAATTIAGYNAFTGIAGAGFTTAGQLGSYIQAPQPNITLSGSGVIGAGTFTGANSGQNSGNSGTIGNENESPKPITTTTTCNAGSAAATGNGGSC